ncbi:MAG: transporter [Planctomycetota bacterium]
MPQRTKLVALAFAGLGSHAYAQDKPAVPPAEDTPSPLVISPDRGSFTDGTSISPVGHVTLETGYTFTFRNRQDVETQRHNSPEITARVGILSDRLEARLTTSGYNWIRGDDGTGAGFAASQGWSDVTLGVKVKLADQEKWMPRMAVEAVSTLGIGTDGISNQIAEPTFKFLWSTDLGAAIDDKWAGYSLSGNLNLAFPTSSGSRFTQAQWSFNAAAPIADKTSMLIEYFGIGPNNKGRDAAHYFSTGGTRLLTDRMQIDARVGVGLNREADNAFVGFGISFLF